jgi:hypothetical protein
MADSPNKSDIAPSLIPPLPPEGVTTTDLIAAGLSLFWLTLAGGFFLFLPSGGDGSFDSLRFVMMLVALILPIAMIWVAATAARSARVMREESRRLQIAIDSMRQTIIAERKQRTELPPAAALDLGPSETAQPARSADAAVATFTTTRDPSRRPTAPRQVQRPADDQPTLALGNLAEDIGPELTRDDMIRALNFPDNEKDEAGFAALRRALKERQARQLIQASQDVLTLLSQDGIYMDDLRPDRAKPEVWRRFASGERGRAVAALGGIRDRSCLALTMGRMREDTIFRDAAHHFLRLFDRMLIDFEPDCTDEEIADLSETRTARAFMLLGRVTGAFD